MWLPGSDSFAYISRATCLQLRSEAPDLFGRPRSLSGGSLIKDCKKTTKDYKKTSRTAKKPTRTLKKLIRTEIKPLRTIKKPP